MFQVFLFIVPVFVNILVANILDIINFRVISELSRTSYIIIIMPYVNYQSIFSKKWATSL